MRRSVRAGALALAIATGAGLVPALVSSAGAASSVACSKLVALPIAKTGGKLKSTLSSCTPATLKAGATSLTAVNKGQQAGTLTETLTWVGGNGTTVAIVKYAGAKGGAGKCPTGDGRVTITGTIKSSTGAAAKIIKAKEALSASVCAVTTGPNQGASSLEPGTKFLL